jgi:type I restriction enzyme M protein
MRKLRRQPNPGRAAVIVHDGVLFSDGVAARTKEELLTQFNLHTIVRLPNGVFAPYTPIPTNILFFDRSGATETIWYYEIPLPGGRKNYTKTKPMQFAEFDDCITWWDNRHETDQAWRVSSDEVLQYDEENNLVSVNLDINNPRSTEELQHRAPAELVASILEKEHQITEIMNEISRLIQERIE